MIQYYYSLSTIHDGAILISSDYTTQPVSELINLIINDFVCLYGSDYIVSRDDIIFVAKRYAAFCDVEIRIDNKYMRFMYNNGLANEDIGIDESIKIIDYDGFDKFNSMIYSKQTHHPAPRTSCEPFH
jgi:hypothetical protein